MKFPQLAAFLALALSIVACGEDGQHWHGTLEQDGKLVQYETYYHAPGVGEKVFGGATGLAYRIVVDGKTVDLAGNYIPGEWNENKGNFLDYSAEFWDAVAEQFTAIKPGKDHEDEYIWIRNVLNGYGETIRRPIGPSQQGLTAAAHAEQAPVSHAGPNDKLTSDVEDAYSREMGEKMAQQLLENAVPEEWGSTRRALNRGFRSQIREPGFEFRQRIELWANSALFGYDHSGTITETFRRPKGTGDNAWVRISEVRACNHGDCPRTKDMKRRQTCDSGVVSDWYVVDAECVGNWMSGHLCNDDTSLQINHAQGVWTGWECPGHNRGIVPKCGRQFK